MHLKKTAVRLTASLVLLSTLAVPALAAFFTGLETGKVKREELQAVLLAHFQPYAPKDSSWAKECDAVVYAVQDAVLAMDEAGLAEDTNLNLKDFVDLAKAAEALERACEAVPLILDGQIDEAMNRCNS